MLHNLAFIVLVNALSTPEFYVQFLLNKKFRETS